MIRLLAIAPEDGWAFVRSEARILLLRPPYGKRRHPCVEEGVVTRAVTAEGFEAADRTFPDWAALFAHLEERFLAERTPLPAALAPESVERILRHAPHSALASLLDRIEHDLLPGRHWDAANGLLARFLAVESPAAAYLKPRAVALLTRAQELRTASGHRWRRLAASQGSPLTTAKYGREALRERAEQIRQRGFFSDAA